MADQPWLRFGDDPFLNENLLLPEVPLEAQMEADWAMVRGEEVLAGPLPRMTDDQLRSFILGVLDNTLFTTRHIRHSEVRACHKCDMRVSAGIKVEACWRCGLPMPVHLEPEVDYRMVFLPLGMGALEGLERDDLTSIGGLWEAYGKALPRAVNGYPMFTSMNVMHTRDWVQAWTIIDREVKRLESMSLDI